MARKPNLQHLENEAKRRAKLPPDTRVADDLRAASKGVATPLVGRDLLPADQQPPETVLPPGIPTIKLDAIVVTDDATTTSVQPPRVLESTLNQPQDQTDANKTPKPKKRRKDGKPWGPAVLKWQDQNDLPLHGVIRVLKKDPKRLKALWRFQQYEDGMTVQQYIDKMGVLKVGPAKAKQDVRWDFSKGFISVTPSE